MALNQKSSLVNEKDEACGQKEITDVDNKESTQNTQVIGSALQVIISRVSLLILYYERISQRKVQILYFVLIKIYNFVPMQPTQSQIVNHHTAMELSPEIQHKEKLIKLLKKEVKRMMEVILIFYCYTAYHVEV